MLSVVYQKLGFIEVVGRAMEGAQYGCCGGALSEYAENKGEVLCDTSVCMLFNLFA